MGLTRVKSLGRGKAKLLAAVAAVAALALPAVSTRAGTVDLGAAGAYAVLATDSMSFNGPGTINGNVAVGQSTNFASPAVINGTLFLGLGVPHQGNVVPTGGIQNVDLSGAIADAQHAATTASGLTATQTLGNLGNNSTINGTGGTNVVDVSGIVLTNGVLTLHGGASDMFIINDTGAFTFGNSNMALTGGVTAANVLFNVSGNVTITGGGQPDFFGTILAPNSDISVHDKTLFGALIGKTIADTSGFTVNGPTPVPLPAPLTSAGAAIAAMGLVTLMRKKTTTLA